MALLGWLVVLAILPMVAPSERIPHLPMPSLFSIVPFMMAGVVSQRLNTLRKSVRA
jgi:hypothetical protein